MSEQKAYDRQTDRYLQNEAFALARCIQRFVRYGPMIILILVWRKFLTKISTIFLHFRSKWPWPFTFRPQINSCGGKWKQGKIGRLGN